MSHPSSCPPPLSTKSPSGSIPNLPASSFLIHPTTIAHADLPVPLGASQGEELPAASHLVPSPSSTGSSSSSGRSPEPPVRLHLPAGAAPPGQPHAPALPSSSPIPLFSQCSLSLSRVGGQPWEHLEEQHRSSLVLAPPPSPARFGEPRRIRPPPVPLLRIWCSTPLPCACGLPLVAIAAASSSFAARCCSSSRPTLQLPGTGSPSSRPPGSVRSAAQDLAGVPQLVRNESLHAPCLALTAPVASPASCRTAPAPLQLTEPSLAACFLAGHKPRPVQLPSKAQRLHQLGLAQCEQLPQSFSFGPICFSLFQRI
nr:WAS/WASL-interacting protein family member 1 [Aegilops tauschii subsp. strangulata]